LCKVTTEFLE